MNTSESTRKVDGRKSPDNILRYDDTIDDDDESSDDEFLRPAFQQTIKHNDRLTQNEIESPHTCRDGSESPDLIPVKPYYKFTLDDLCNDYKHQVEHVKEMDEIHEELKNDLEHGGFVNMLNKEETPTDESFTEEQRLMLKQIEVQETRLHYDWPGCVLFKPERFQCLYNNTLHPTHCGFMATNDTSKLEKYIESLNVDNYKMILASQLHHRLFLKVQKLDQLLQWIFLQMSINNDEQLQNGCKEILMNILHTRYIDHVTKWTPSFIDMLSILVNYGASLESLLPCTDSEIQSYRSQILKQPGYVQQQLDLRQPDNIKREDQDQRANIKREDQDQLANIKREDQDQLANIKHEDQDQLANIKREDQDQLANIKREDQDQLANIKREDREERVKHEHIDQKQRQLSEYWINNLILVIKVLTQSLNGQIGRYSANETSLLFYILCKIVLEPSTKTCAYAMEVIQNCLTVVINQYTESDWSEEKLRLCYLLSDISSHHHDHSYLAQLLPRCKRGLYIQQRYCYLVVNQIFQYKTSISDNELDQFEICYLEKFTNDVKDLLETDPYTVSSVIRLLDLSVGLTYTCSNIKHREQLRSLLEKLSHIKVKDSIGMLDRARVKSMIVMITRRWSLDLQTVRRKQRKMFEYTNMDVKIETLKQNDGDDDDDDDDDDGGDSDDGDDDDDVNPCKITKLSEISDHE